MSYIPNTWSTGDTITAAKLNNIEQGIASVENNNNNNNGGWDAEVYCYHEDNSGTPYQFTIVSGTFSDLNTMLTNKQPPAILFRYFFENQLIASTTAIAVYYIDPSSSITFIARVPPLSSAVQDNLFPVLFTWHSNDTITEN